jgi:hypothetical protein
VVDALNNGRYRVASPEPLRVGNWVQARGGEIGIITLLKDDGMVFVDFEPTTSRLPEEFFESELTKIDPEQHKAQLPPTHQ